MSARMHNVLTGLDKLGPYRGSILIGVLHEDNNQQRKKAEGLKEYRQAVRAKPVTPVKEHTSK